MRTAFITALLATLLGCAQSNLPTVPESNTDTDLPHPELEFFNSLSGKLDIELTAPTEKIGKLDNVRATSEAKVKSLKLAVDIYDSDADTFRELTSEELQSVAFRGSQIILRGEGGGTVTHQAPNGRFFTVEGLLMAVEQTERETRDQSEWFDGVDVHHVFFEGIHQGEDGVWEIDWGS